MAQIDVKVPVDIVDCSSAPDTQKADCLSADTATEALQYHGKRKSLTAVKLLGRGFATVGGGVMYAIAPNHGPVLNVDLIVPFPSVSFVIEPSLGYAFGF